MTLLLCCIFSVFHFGQCQLPPRHTEELKSKLQPLPKKDWIHMGKLNQVCFCWLMTNYGSLPKERPNQFDPSWAPRPTCRSPAGQSLRSLRRTAGLMAPTSSWNPSSRRRGLCCQWADPANREGREAGKGKSSVGAPQDGTCRTCCDHQPQGRFRLQTRLLLASLFREATC